MGIEVKWRMSSCGSAAAVFLGSTAQQPGQPAVEACGNNQYDRRRAKGGGAESYDSMVMVFVNCNALDADIAIVVEVEARREGQPFLQLQVKQNVLRQPFFPRAHQSYCVLYVHYAIMVGASSSAWYEKEQVISPKWDFPLRSRLSNSA